MAGQTFTAGSMFYEMLTGTHPRRNLSNVAILGMLAAEGKFSPRVSSSVPAEHQTVVKTSYDIVLLTA